MQSHTSIPSKNFNHHRYSKENRRKLSPKRLTTHKKRQEVNNSIATISKEIKHRHIYNTPPPTHTHTAAIKIKITKQQLLIINMSQHHWT
jgi:hypothetical protein